MKTIEYRDVIDKTTWGPGPWQDEPDKKQWQDEATGLPCLAVRNEWGGHWCGYVGVSEGHKLFKKHYDDADIEVHGGLTYSEFCAPGDECESVCHVPEPDETDHVWWLGFDCMHHMDCGPAHESRHPTPHTIPQVYRDLGYVEEQCRLLAKQLAGET